MSADRKNYVMSMEFAMQREMAYREKLRAEGANDTKPCASNHTLPSQVSSVSHIKQVLAPESSQAPKTASVPVLPPNSTLCPTVRPAFNPIPCSYTGPRRMQSPLQKPHSLHNISTTSSTPRLTVEPITPTPCTGPTGPGLLQSPLQRPSSQYSRPINGPTPYTGRGLLQSPRFQGPRPRPGATQKKQKPLHRPPQAEDYRCNLCDVNCNSEFNLRMHLKGQKHKAKLCDSRSMEVSSGVMLSQQQGAIQKKYCSLCEVWCPDEKAFRMHVDGRNHILKYHAAEKRMKLCH